MALTRAIAATVLVKRLGPLMEAAGMVVTILGANADLADPLAWATRRLGGSTANASTVTDAEMAGITETDDFLDLAEHRTLQNILGSLDDVDITVGPRSESLSQLAAQAQSKLDRIEARSAGLFVRPLEMGYMTLDFVEHG